MVQWTPSPATLALRPALSRKLTNGRLQLAALRYGVVNGGAGRHHRNTCKKLAYCSENRFLTKVTDRRLGDWRCGLGNMTYQGDRIQQSAAMAASEGHGGTSDHDGIISIRTRY